MGQVTSAAWSPDFETNVAIGMVRMTHWDAGTVLEVETPDGMRPAVVQDKVLDMNAASQPFGEGISGKVK